MWTSCIKHSWWKENKSHVLYTKAISCPILISQTSFCATFNILTHSFPKGKAEIIVLYDLRSQIPIYLKSLKALSGSCLSENFTSDLPDFKPQYQFFKDIMQWNKVRACPMQPMCIPHTAFCIESKLTIPIVCRDIYSQVLILVDHPGDSESVFPIQLK